MSVLNTWQSYVRHGHAISVEQLIFYLFYIYFFIYFSFDVGEIIVTGQDELYTNLYL